MKFISMVIAVVLYAAFAGWANADPQINQQEQRAHFPFDRDDTDREFKFSPVVSGIIQDGDLRSIRVIVTQQHLCADLPQELQDLGQGETLTIAWWQDNDGEPCNITDTDGNETAVTKWASRAVMLDDFAAEVARHGICRVEHKLWCTTE